MEYFLTLCRFYQNKNLIGIIELLIQHGIDINCKNNEGWNALIFLCRHYQNKNSIEIIRILIQHGIDVDCKNSKDRMLSLYCVSFIKKKI